MGKAEGYLFGFIGIFLLIATLVYWFSSKDPTGTTCLALSTALGALCAFYLTVAARRAGPRPEDRYDAEISEGSGDLGHFSPGSPWPIALAASAAGFFIGFIFGLWISFIAVAGLLYSLTGLLLEHYKGVNARTEEIIGVSPTGMSGHG